MSQERLNYLMLLSIHKNKTDELKLIDVANQFCQGNRVWKIHNKRFPKSITHLKN